MIGVLKLAAQYVPVRGIIAGNVGEQVVSEVTDFKDEAPNLSLHFWKHGNLRGMDEPHQKLIVIDGLIAFKGSANLTHLAWRSAIDDMDLIEVVTDVEDVIILHNRFFSSLWGRLSKFEDEIHMDPMDDDDVPF
jgi:phosphatidylserine/phosphatidylglycerophosphate/cardiolipin synthase-like enzyme